ncbi:MAG: hypothetical protein K0Q81_183, partial [Paenibacillus sp.]|nr:hypothetical protein [Paenibacillus sp.]
MVTLGDSGEEGGVHGGSGLEYVPEAA